MLNFDQLNNVDEILDYSSNSPFYDLEDEAYDLDLLKNFYSNFQNGQDGQNRTNDLLNEDTHLDMNLEDFMQFDVPHIVPQKVYPRMILNSCDSLKNVDREQANTSSDNNGVHQENTLLYTHNTTGSYEQNIWSHNTTFDDADGAESKFNIPSNFMEIATRGRQNIDRELDIPPTSFMNITEDYISRVRSSVSIRNSDALNINKPKEVDYYVLHLQKVRESAGERAGERLKVPWDDIDLRKRYIYDKLKISVILGKYNGSKYSPKVVGNSSPATPKEPVIPQKEFYSFFIPIPSNCAIGNYDEAILSNYSAEPLGFVDSKAITRRKYFRGPSIYEFLQSIHTNGDFELIYNDRCDDHLYAPEFYLVEINGIPKDNVIKPDMRMNKTRRALCPFCPTLQFFLVNVSSYGQHVCQHHGVLSDGYMIPNPLNPGYYTITKSNTCRRTKPKPRSAKGVYCPVCYSLIEVEASVKTKDKQPLMGYLTHFKTEHSSPERGKKRTNRRFEPKTTPSFLKFRQCILDSAST